MQCVTHTAGMPDINNVGHGTLRDYNYTVMPSIKAGRRIPVETNVRPRLLFKPGISMCVDTKTRLYVTLVYLENQACIQRGFSEI